MIYTTSLYLTFIIFYQISLKYISYFPTVGQCISQLCSLSINAVFYNNLCARSYQISSKFLKSNQIDYTKKNFDLNYLFTLARNFIGDHNLKYTLLGAPRQLTVRTLCPRPWLDLPIWAFITATFPQPAVKTQHSSTNQVDSWSVSRM